MHYPLRLSTQKCHLLHYTSFTVILTSCDNTGEVLMHIHEMLISMHIHEMLMSMHIYEMLMSMYIHEELINLHLYNT